jgi:glycosyltransferase involved in cell wall biosynthesis
MNPKVSIIIPTYNRATLLKRAIASVYAQTYRPVELIIINDGSNDNTEEIVEEFKKTGSVSLVYVKQEKKERVAARNHGIDMASGEYIAFLDDDDEFLPNKIEKQIGYFLAHPEIDCLFTNYYLEENGAVRLFRESLASEGLTKHSHVQITKRLCRGNLISPLSIMIKSSILKQEHFNPIFLTHEDYELWLRLCSKYRFDFIDEPLSIYHAHDSAIRYEYDLPKIDQLNILLDYLNSFPECFDVLFQKIIRIYKVLREHYLKIGKNNKLEALNKLFVRRISIGLQEREGYVNSNSRLIMFINLFDLFLKRQQIRALKL